MTAAAEGRVKAGNVALDAAERMTKDSGKVGDSLRKLALDLARRTLDSWDRSDSPASASAKPSRPAEATQAAQAAEAGQAGEERRKGRKRREIGRRRQGLTADSR